MSLVWPIFLKRRGRLLFLICGWLCVVRERMVYLWRDKWVYLWRGFGILGSFRRVHLLKRFAFLQGLALF
jgi:hypothetical protein